MSCSGCYPRLREEGWEVVSVTNGTGGCVPVPTRPARTHAYHHATALRQDSPLILPTRQELLHLDRNRWGGTNPAHQRPYTLYCAESPTRLPASGCAQPSDQILDTKQTGDIDGRCWRALGGRWRGESARNSAPAIVTSKRTQWASIGRSGLERLPSGDAWLRCHWLVPP